MNITLEQLLEAGAHYGHTAKRWNPKMAPFIYTVKDGVHVFDLAKTRDAMVTALTEIKKAAGEGKLILLVGTKKQAKERVKQIGQSLEIPYITERWLGGTLTNFQQVLRSVRKMTDLKEKVKTGQLSEFTKKERLLISRDIEKLERFVGGLTTLSKIPDLIIIIDTHHEKGATVEAAKMNVATVGVVDTNADPEEVTYPIPMNDDASSSLELVLGLIEGAIIEGKKAKPAKAVKEVKPKKTTKNAKN